MCFLTAKCGERRLQRPEAKGGGVYRAELFTHDAKTNQMICPENKRLPFRYFDRPPGRTIRVYSARKEECPVCPSRQACCGQSKLKQTGRRITVSEDQLPMRRFEERMSTAHASRSIANAPEWPSFLMLGSKANADCGSS